MSCMQFCYINYYGLMKNIWYIFSKTNQGRCIRDLSKLGHLFKLGTKREQFVQHKLACLMKLFLKNRWIFRGEDALFYVPIAECWNQLRWNICFLNILHLGHWSSQSPTVTRDIDIMDFPLPIMDYIWNAIYLLVIPTNYKLRFSFK